MIKVRISTTFPEWPLIRQTPASKGIWGNCEFFVNEIVDECDYWFVYSDLLKKERAYCPECNTILITGEPESVRKYSEKYLLQFGRIITCQRDIPHKYIIYNQQAYPWFVGRRVKGNKNISFSKDYDELMSIKQYKKDKLLSVICSNKTFTEGHKKRIEFVMALADYFKGIIDVYGRGIADIEDKWDAIARYKYHIVLENSNYFDYWTEKLSDAFLGGAYPLYYGCPNIFEYFPNGSLSTIDINDFIKSVNIIENTILNSQYEKSIDNISIAKNMVLNKYNLFAMINDFCSTEGNRYSENSNKKLITINPENTFTFSINNVKSRLKTLLKYRF